MGQISGLLFFQGETDALDPIQYPQPEPHPAEWAQLFSTFITDFREDLDQPNLPVIYAQIGSNMEPEAFINWEIVQEQQASVSLPITAMIITDDLPLMDGVHFTTDSYRTIGERFAGAFWNLVDLKPHPVSREVIFILQSLPGLTQVYDQWWVMCIGNDVSSC
jgi:hypothetical protein